MMDMSFYEAVDLYREVYKRYEKVEGKPWGINGAMIELAKQVGDLSACVMKKENYYAQCEIPKDIDDKIGNELADIFGQIIRIADYYNINLLEAHKKAREDESDCLNKMNV